MGWMNRRHDRLLSSSRLVVVANDGDDNEFALPRVSMSPLSMNDNVVLGLVQALWGAMCKQARQHQ